MGDDYRGTANLGVSQKFINVTKLGAIKLNLRRLAMKKIILSLFLLLFLPALVSAESGNLQKIEVKKTFWGYKYYCMDQC